MGSLSRILPFVWPHRGKVLASVIFATMVAAIWGGSVSAIGPLMEGLREEQGLHGWVDSEIAEANANIEERSALLTELPAADMQKRARVQKRLTEAHNDLVWMQRVKTNVMQFVPHDKFHAVGLILGLLLLATAFKGVFMYLQEVLIGSVVHLSVMGIRKECFRHCLKLDYQMLTATGTSDLMSRFTNDMEQLANGLRVIGVRIVREPLKALSCIMLAFVVNWRLALLSVLVVPAIAVVFYQFGRAMKRASKATMESMVQIYKSVAETFDRIKVVKAFEGGRKHRQQFHRENKAYYHKAMKTIASAR